jgi:hypothetical protein
LAAVDTSAALEATSPVALETLVIDWAISRVAAVCSAAAAEIALVASMT